MIPNLVIGMWNSEWEPGTGTMVMEKMGYYF